MVVKRNGNGTVEIKTWLALFSGLVLIVSASVSVYAFVKYEPVKICVDGNSAQIKENRHRIERLEKNESARDERDEWIRSTLTDMSQKIDRLYEMRQGR